MVRELFEMARTKKACLIFFDEIDAVGGARFDDGAGGDNEVQRTMLELINQLRFRNFDRALEQAMASIVPSSTAEESDKETSEAKLEASELQSLVVARLGGWYMASHGVNVKSKVEVRTKQAIGIGARPCFLLCWFPLVGVFTHCVGCRT